MRTLNEHIGDLNKLLKNADIDTPNITCLYPDCSNKAIYSHSIQENGILDILEADIPRKGKKIYSIEDYPEIDFTQKHISSYFKARRQLKDFGKNDSSGLLMFCKEHDSKIFTEIEHLDYKSTSNQQFLYAIRAYLHDTRKAVLCYTLTQNRLSEIKKVDAYVNEINKLLAEFLNITNKLPDSHIISVTEAKALKEFQENSVLKVLNLTKQQANFENLNFTGKTGAETKSILNAYIQLLTNLPNFSLLHGKFDKGIEEMKTDFRQAFNFFVQLIINQSKNSFEYKSWSFKIKIPIAGSFVVRGTNLQNQNAPLFSFTIFPSKKTTETFVILSSLVKEQSKMFFSQLNTLTDLELQFALSNIIMKHGTNTFISPRMWDKFTETEKEYFLTTKSQKGTFQLNNIDYTLNLFAEKYHE